VAKQPAKKKAAKKKAAKKPGKHGGKRPGAGRPPKPLDWKLVGQLNVIHCTIEEICACVHVDKVTLYSRCKKDLGVDYSTYAAEKRGEGKASLRRVQLQAAMAGDKTMLVWLGKNLLGQEDRKKHEVDLKVGQWSDSKVREEARRILLEETCDDGSSDSES